MWISNDYPYFGYGENWGSNRKTKVSSSISDGATDAWAVWYGPLPSTNLQDTSLFLTELLLHLMSPLRRSKTLLTSHQSQVYGLMPSILSWSGHSDARNDKRIPQKLDNYHIKEFISTVTLSHPFFRVFFNQTIFNKWNISYFLKYSLCFFLFTFLI